MEAAILVGGQARRFGGRDKSALRIGSTTILERQIAVLGPLADRVFIVASGRGRVDARGLAVVLDRLPGTGTLGALYTALSASTAEFTLVVACDMPFLTARFLAHLADSAPGFDLAIPRSSDGLQPMCAMYSRSCLEPIRARVAETTLRVQDLATEVRTREIGPDEIAAFDPDGVLFFNVNTPADYRRAVEIAARYEDRIMRVSLRRQQDQ